MSGNKMTDVKNIDDLDLDSGFISGDIGKDFLGSCVDSGEIRLEPEEAEPPKSDEKEISILDMDSGVVNDDVSIELSKCVFNMNLTDCNTELPSASSVRPQVTDLPLELLFQQDDDGDTYVSISMCSHC